MKYYIFQHNWKFNLLKQEEPLWAYSGKFLNFGGEVEDIPKVTLTFKSKKLPDSIPNVNNCLIFNKKLIEELVAIDRIQFFDIDIQDHAGTLISDEYRCLNILIEAKDVIDFENSKFIWSDIYEGQTEEDRYIMSVLDLRFDYSKINNEPFFAIKHIESLIAFREDLAENIIRKKYTGLEFYPAEGYGS